MKKAFIILMGIFALMPNLGCKANGYIVNDDKPEPFEYRYNAKYDTHDCFMRGSVYLSMDIHGNPITTASLFTNINKNGFYGCFFKFNTTNKLLKSLLPQEENKMYDNYISINLSNGEKLFFIGTIDFEKNSINNFSYTSFFISVGTEAFPLLKSNKSSLESYTIKQANEYAMNKLCESNIESINWGNSLFGVERGIGFIDFSHFHTRSTFKAMRDKLVAMKGQG